MNLQERIEIIDSQVTALESVVKAAFERVVERLRDIDKTIGLGDLASLLETTGAPAEKATVKRQPPKIMNRISKAPSKTNALPPKLSKTTKLSTAEAVRYVLRMAPDGLTSNEVFLKVAEIQPHVNVGAVYSALGTVKKTGTSRKFRYYAPTSASAS